MDFTLSLAHFCEVHGPTSVLCTQVLPAECSSCLPSSPSSSTATPPEKDGQSYFSIQPERRPASSGHGAFITSDGDRCTSCRMILPDDNKFESSKPSEGMFKADRDRHPLRTTEDVHVCTADFDMEEVEQHFHFSPISVHSPRSDMSCHNHKLDYVSSSNPADSETFSGLRRATIRTLSGEQLPRGQTSGPLWFGDPIAGYTIAYVFRLADMHARGRQRYYALLALAGNDTQRAFEACTVIWALFEQIAMHIVRRADEVSDRSAFEDSPPERGQITPISSFLIGRTMDPDGVPRHGASYPKANSIAQLVDNDSFFAELHVMFVGILQELGRHLGGMRVRPVEYEAVSPLKGKQAEVKSRHEEPEKESPHSTLNKTKPSPTSSNNTIPYSSQITSPSLVHQRQTVVV